MRPISRKQPRFFVINPEIDRRNEVRFVSRESVVLRVQKNKKVYPGTAYDIGQKGLKIETSDIYDIGEAVQISFPNSPDHVHCFGFIAWVRPKPFGKCNEIGIGVNTWMGIVEGNQSWKQFKGFKPKTDRRNIKR